MSLYSTYQKNKTGFVLKRSVSVVILLIFAIFTLFPIYFMIISSFADPVEAGAASMSLLPQKLTLASYKFFFQFSPYSLRWIINSLIVATIITVSNVIFSGLAGYAFSKINFKGRNAIFYLLLSSMMIPYQVVQVPLYILVVNVFKLSNTYAALVLPDLCTIYNIFLTKQFMSSIPYEIIESAKIEGCNQFQIYTKIIAPISKTILAVMAILTFMGSWNAFFWPFLVTSNTAMQTIQVGLKAFRFANTTYLSPMMAGATISALPMFILFFSLQKYFLEGVVVGAVKG